MFCGNCKKEVNEKDFINKQEFCFRCMYRIKTTKIRKKKVNVKKKCRICKKEIFNDESLKKAPRTIYCSKDCAYIGHKKQVNNYWTRKIYINDAWGKAGEKNGISIRTRPNP